MFEHKKRIKSEPDERRKVFKRTFRSEKEKYQHSKGIHKTRYQGRQDYNTNLELEDALFHPESVKNPSNFSIVERFADKIGLLQIEWSTMYSTVPPFRYLWEIKGYSQHQAMKFMHHAPKEEWEKKREHFQNKLSENLAERNVEIVSKMNDENARSGKLGLVKGLEFLSKGVTVTKYDVKTKKTTSFVRPLYPIEYNYVMSALKSSQSIYRVALGLPADGEGMQQILDKLDQKSTIQNNLQININNPSSQKENESIKALIKDLTPADIAVFVERKRELMAAKKESESNLMKETDVIDVDKTT